MPDGNVRQNEKSIGYVGRDERNIARRIDVGGWQQGRNGDWHPEVEIGWLGSERDEYGILSIRFDGLGAVSERDPQRSGLTLVGARATARLHLPSDDLFSFDLTLTAPQLAAFTSRGSVRLSFDVTGGRGLKWLYQTPLTNAEEVEPGILEGLDGGETVRRPVWADGSWAVYHTSLRHDRNDGFGNWRRAGTGKICHVRRPHVTDLATGDVLWGEIEVADGGLTLIFDALLFAGRVGPFVFDPDVGYTSIGGTGSNVASTLMVGSGSHSMPETGNVQSLSFYCDNASNHTLGLYDDSDDSLIAQTAEFAAPASGDWNTNNTTSNPSVTSATVLWVARGASGSHRHFYDAATEGANTNNHVYSGGNMPDPITWDSKLYGRDISAFMSYTASGGGGSILPQMMQHHGG